MSGRQFLISSSFTDSLARLAGDEQKQVKLTAVDLQLDPSAPGLQLHRLESNKEFWSVRVSRDIRIIIHQSESSFLLCYAGHHDDAYRWAKGRKLERHPRTGAAQLVEIRETVREVVVPTYVAAAPLPVEPKAPERRSTLAALSTEDLLQYGVPAEWIADVRAAGTDDEVMSVCEHLPAEASEAVMELWSGRTPPVPAPQPVGADPFVHPDAMRRFRLLANRDELEQALAAPWDRWVVFLHPDQRQIVDRRFSGPARVTGTAGTGKTIVAVHRAVHLARRESGARVLLTTFSDTLANALAAKVRALAGLEPRVLERLEVSALDSLAVRMHAAGGHSGKLASEGEVLEAIRNASASVAGHRFGVAFLASEWLHIVDAWQIASWDSYRDVARLGRKTRLAESQRRVLWQIFESVRGELSARGLRTMAGIYNDLVGAMQAGKSPSYTHVVVDEAQDLSVAQLRFLAQLVGTGSDSIFFAGDIGQRIFQQPFSWRSLGVDVRGRSRNLRVNYRTSHQIRTQADRLLDGAVTDADGETAQRADTISVFNGTAPIVRRFQSEEDEIRGVGDWLKGLVRDGLSPHEMAVVVRSEEQIARAASAVQSAGVPSCVIDARVEVRRQSVPLLTMHLAKGLEFRAVAVMACDDDVVPLQSRIAGVGELGDLEEVYDTERHLLYVACTRARDHLAISGVAPVSEFLDDMA